MYMHSKNVDLKAKNESLAISQRYSGNDPRCPPAWSLQVPGESSVHCIRFLYPVGVPQSLVQGLLLQANAG
jgi:hypothetical protein